MQSKRRTVAGLLVAWQVLLAATLLAAMPAVTAQTAQASAPATAATAGGVAHGSARMQVHRTWAFAADGVTFSNRMPGARLNAVQRLGPDRYAVTIEPESLPINPSPWFGFSVVARQPGRVSIEFRYAHGFQRYWPKLSTDGVHWRAALSDEFVKTADGRNLLRVAVGTQPLRVFAQQPILPADFARWEDGLNDKVSVRTRVIGHSVQGRPLHMLAFGAADARQVLLVIGRQHPPETTGSEALMSFVDQLVADTPLARRFRKHVLVLVVPLMNPDGVVEGNWRGNADGKDINRDWGPFNEPETRAVRDMLRRRLDGQDRTLGFAIDFHSTWSDVFYTVKEAPSRQPGGVLRRWVDVMQARFPGRIREKANAAKSTVFKNWAYTRYHAPTVTYEVGDRTSARQLDTLATFAADRMMQLLTPRPE